MAEVIPVYILAGGRSSRFGSDKARAPIAGEPLLLQVARTLAAGGPVTVVAARSDAYRDLGLRTIADARPGLGPLGGLASALADRVEGWLLLAACDTLGLDPRWLGPLLAARSAAPAVAFRGAHWEPMPALYHTRLAATVDERLAREESRERSLHGLLRACGATAVPLPEGWAAVRSINTRADLGG